MKPQGLFACSQQPVTYLYLQPVKLRVVYTWISEIS